MSRRTTGDHTLASGPLIMLMSNKSTDTDRVLSKTLRSGSQTALINAHAFNGKLIRSIHDLTSNSKMTIAITECLAPDNHSVGGCNVSPSLTIRLGSRRHSHLTSSHRLVNADRSPRFTTTLGTLILRVHSTQNRGGIATTPTGWTPPHPSTDPCSLNYPAILQHDETVFVNLNVT